MKFRDLAGQKRFGISTPRTMLMGQIKINKKEHRISAVGTKKPWFRTFPEMFSHLGQGRKTRDKRARGVDGERSKKVE